MGFGGRVALAGVLAAALAADARAALGSVEGLAPERLFPWASFDPRMPTPTQVTGVVPGSRPLRHAELLRYLEALDEASDRVRVVQYATSHEGRPLVYVAVGEPETVADLEAFRKAHLERVDALRRTPEQDRQALASAKAVAWMAYGIHGDELSSVDAAAALLYWLAAGEDERARGLRRELLVLVDPCENPDGRERFLALTAAFAHVRPNPDTDDLSHTTVWPWGRGNHYLFDLNRDWFTLVQPESRRSEVIASWLPQLMVDSHEMGPHDTYLFPPPRHPFNPHLPPDSRRWWDRFSADQARVLDERGYGYYTREWNEEFFPGYGSSWASYHGAIGILYEMSSTEGTLVKQRGGTLRTYAQAVEHHVASSVANLETLAANREEILRDFVRGRREAARSGAEGPVRAWLFLPGHNPEWADELAALLRRLGVEVLRLAEPTRAESLRDARTGETRTMELPAGTWMVPLDQPAARMARVLLDPHVPMEAAFLREEREYLERGKGSRLYDTTAWALPLLRGVEAYWTGRKPGGAWRDDPVPQPAGALVEPEPSTPVYGYLFDGGNDRAAFALAEMLEKEIAVRVAEKPFRVAGRAYGRGSVLVPREGNPDSLPRALREVAQRWRVEIRPTPTARAEEGPDLGGSHFLPLIRPRIGVFAGWPVSPSDYGALWHLLDVEAGARFTALEVGRFAVLDLARFNVLVFPPAMEGARAYRAAIGQEGLDRLRRWIEAGGTAIGIGSGAEFLSDKDAGLTSARLRRQALDRYPPPVLGIPAEEAEMAGPFRAAGLAPAETDSDDTLAQGGGQQDGSKGKTKGRSLEPAAARRASPYDIAPLLGPGALPFAEGFPQGTPVSTELVGLRDWLRLLLPPGKREAELEDVERADARLRRFMPQGAILAVELDPESWLSWGLPPRIAVWFGASDTFIAESPVQVAARFEPLERLHLGGLLWPEAAGRIARTAYCTREALGRGQVILFAEHPAFRGWPRESRRLLWNALVYGPGLGTQWSNPW